jgi:hypothetical protein
MSEVTATDLDLALRRLAEFVTIRERMRIAEILTLPEAQANLQLAVLLAVGGSATLEAARTALLMAGEASGATPN